tara:strand:+ start:1086 stop:2093 length:1008 start_codon:yes stop_codon:yes gene_type:complete
MSKIQESEENKNLPATSKYSLDDMKSIFYLMNAKPDTSIQLLEGKKRINLSDIRDLNERIQRKLQNHHLIGQIASINIIFEKGKIQDYATWAEFERETWHTINNKTEAISLTWDISLKLKRYENPQRHTLKVRIGQAISPKDMMELVFSSDNASELREKRADGIVKVDFIDQVIAGELIEKVINWHEGLKSVPDEIGIQKYLEKHQSLFVGIIHNYVPIIFLAIYHYYFLKFCDWGKIEENLNLTNIQLILIIFITVFFTGSMFGKKFARWVDKKIDDYTDFNEFEITKGDENAFEEANQNNKKITKKLMTKIVITIITTIVAFIIGNLLEHFIN